MNVVGLYIQALLCKHPVNKKAEIMRAHTVRQTQI